MFCTTALFRPEQNAYIFKLPSSSMILLSNIFSRSVAFCLLYPANRKPCPAHSLKCSLLFLIHQSLGLAQLSFLLPFLLLFLLCLFYHFGLLCFASNWFSALGYTDSYENIDTWDHQTRFEQICKFRQCLYGEIFALQNALLSTGEFFLYILVKLVKH